jgi:hypothetical protein
LAGAAALDAQPQPEPFEASAGLAFSCLVIEFSVGILQQIP